MAHIVIDGRIRRSSTGRYADRLLDHLQRIDSTNKYSVLVQPDDSWQPTSGNFTRIDCPYKQFSFNPLEQIGFTRQLKSLSPDLVHFTMTQSPIFYTAKNICTTHDLTMLKHVRPGDTPLPVFWLKKLGYRLLFWWGHKKAARIIVPTNFVKIDLEAYQPFTRGKVTVTYEASEPPLDVLASRPNVIPENSRFVAYAGSAFPHKNLKALVDAFGLLLEQKPDFKLVLCGKIEHYYKQLQKYAADKPYADKIIITGFISDAELKWVYENAGAYVFPSLSEGFGLPGLEAMAHGCPVVSSNATCLPEVYGDAAHYFDPESVEEMAVKIGEVLDSEALRSKLIAQGSKQVSKYSWGKMAQETLEIYKTVLGE